MGNGQISLSLAPQQPKPQRTQNHDGDDADHHHHHHDSGSLSLDHPNPHCTQNLSPPQNCPFLFLDAPASQGVSDIDHDYDVVIVDNDDDENFQQVFKAKLRCQVKPIAPSGARLGSRQANANHHADDDDYEDGDDDYDGIDDNHSQAHDARLGSQRKPSYSSSSSR